MFRGVGLLPKFLGVCFKVPGLLVGGPEGLVGRELMAGFDLLVVGDAFDAVVDGVGNIKLAVPFGVGDLVDAFLPLAFECEADEDNDEGDNEEDDDDDVGHVGGLQVYGIGGSCVMTDRGTGGVDSR